MRTEHCMRADPHPGNIAVDAEGGGRLIYYDFGMMGSIPGDVRAGLLELFYGVYQKDPDRCIEALMSMGVLVPGGDRVAIRRTAVFFLKSFEVRILHCSLPFLPRCSLGISGGVKGLLYLTCFQWVLMLMQQC